MEEQDSQKAVLHYAIHIADNQTRIAEAIVALGTQTQAIAAIRERVVQTTDRTEHMVASRLTCSAPDKVSHSLKKR